jgi:hypothetical protein
MTIGARGVTRAAALQPSCWRTARAERSGRFNVDRSRSVVADSRVEAASVEWHAPTHRDRDDA